MLYHAIENSTDTETWLDHVRSICLRVFDLGLHLNRYMILCEHKSIELVLANRVSVLAGIDDI